MVHRITQTRRGASVLAGDTEFQSEFVIFAAPTFLAPYLLEDFPRLHDFVYSPWLTANLTLDRYPDSRGAEPSWDTVFLDSPTLGYVDAMHQSLRTHVDRTVWTFYWALAEGAPAQNRQLLLEKDWAYWKEAILHDLERVHSDIRQCVSRIDIMRMGHAMIRPAVCAIFSEERPHSSRRPPPLRQLRPQRHLYLRGSPIPRRRSRPESVEETPRLATSDHRPLATSCPVTFLLRTTLMQTGGRWPRLERKVQSVNQVPASKLEKCT
jgi:hypothetical protein